MSYHTIAAARRIEDPDYPTDTGDFIADAVACANYILARADEPQLEAASNALCRNHRSGFAEPCAGVCHDTIPGQPHPCEHAMDVWSGDAEEILRALNDKVPTERHEVTPSLSRPVAGDVVEALRAAKQFIDNGVELGFIRMPASAYDPAHATLPKIEAALAALSAEAPDGSPVKQSSYQTCPKWAAQLAWQEGREEAAKEVERLAMDCAMHGDPDDCDVCTLAAKRIRALPPPPKPAGDGM